MDTQHQQLSEQFRNQASEYLVRIAAEPADPLETAIFFLSLSPNDLRPSVVSAWRAYLKKHAKADDPVFGPWHDLLELGDKDFANGAAKVVEKWSAVSEGADKG